MRWSLIFFSLLAVPACSAPDLPPPLARSDTPDLDRHLVVLNSRGEGEEPGRTLVAAAMPEADREVAAWCPEPRHRTQGGLLRERFVCVVRNMLAQYRSWTTEPDPRLPPQSVLKLMIYFNGGLNDREDALGTAADSYRFVEQTGIYPVYMVWPTGPVSTYGEDVLQVRQGRWTPATDPWTLVGTPLRPPTDLVRGIASTPAAWGTSFKEFAQTGFGLGNAAYSMASDRDILVREGEKIGPDRNLYFSHQDSGGTGTIDADKVGRDGASGGSAPRLLNYAYYGALAPVRALSAPFMIGFGEAGWRNMVRRTRTSVRAVPEHPEELAPARPAAADGPLDCTRDDDPALLHRCYPRGSGGFSRFFQWLESCSTGLPIAKGADPCPLTGEDLEAARSIFPERLRITMIGHSMGAIVVNELLQLYPDLPYESLVYMAGAASVRDTAKAVVPILRENGGCTRLFALMPHPLNEQREPTAKGFLLSGSLLTYVDEYLENPKTLTDRTVGQWHNLRQSLHLFPRGMQRWMHLRVFDRAAPVRDAADRGSPKTGNPTTHGAFNDPLMPFWNEQGFWKPTEVTFDQPQMSCERLFSDRFGAAIEKARPL